MRNAPLSLRQRRHCLRLLATLGGWAVISNLRCAPAAARRAAQKRVVVLDWGLTEIVLSLGVTPVGVSRPPWYRQLDGDPALPAAVVDTGLLYQPNFEVLAALRPDLIIVNPMHLPLVPWLKQIASVFSVTLYRPGKATYSQIQVATSHLAEALDRKRAAEDLLREVEQTLASCAGQLRASEAWRHPCYIIKPINGRYVTVYGANSLFGGVMARLGGTNAWRGSVDLQGVAETDISALAELSQAALILLEDAASLAPLREQNPLWRALPAVQERRVYPLGKLYPQGGLVTAQRFAKGLVRAVDAGAHEPV